MKKFLKIIVIITLVLALLFVGFVLFMQYIDSQSITGDDGVAEKYFEKIETSVAGENFYKNLGKEEISYVSHQSSNAKIKKFHIFYPKNLENSLQKFPAVVFVNGTFTPAEDYLPILEHLASWGFVAIGNDDEKSGFGNEASETLDYLLALNNDVQSVFYHKIDVENIGISGHSQGGAGAINAVTKFENSNVFKALYTASAVGESIASSNGWSYDASQINIPYFMMAGSGKSDSWLSAKLSDLKKIFGKISSDKVVIMARRKGIDHKDVLEYGDAYMTAWFLWNLKNDESAKKIFGGNEAEIFYNENWQDVAVKNL